MREAIYSPRWSRRRSALLLAACCVVAAMGVGAAPAKATVYCVAAINPESIDTSCTPGAGKTTIQSALNAAGNNGVSADTVRIGPGTFNEHSIFFDGFLQNGRVSIIGSGSGLNGTTISPTIANGTAVDYILSIYNYGGTGDVSDLKVEVPAGASASSLSSGIEGRRLALSNVVVSATKPSNMFGVMVEDSTITTSNIAVPASDTSAGAYLYASGSTGENRLSYTTVNGPVYVDATDEASIDHARITSQTDALIVQQIQSGGHFHLGDSLISTGSGTGRRGVVIEDTEAGAQTFTAEVERSTIIGSGNSTRGIRLYARDGDDFHLDLRDSVILGQDLPFFAARAGTGNATVEAAYSAYDTTGPKARAVEPAGNLTEGAGIVNSAAGGFNPGFTDAAGGDYSLLATSPFVDVGRTWNSPAFTDLAGARRPVRKSCSATGDAHSDLGAYEYQPPAPSATIVEGPAEGSVISDTTPTFTFSSSFTCVPKFSLRIDPLGANAGINGTADQNSSWTSPTLTDGDQTFTLWALSEGGTFGSPVTRTFTVDATPPGTSIVGKGVFKAAKGKATATYSLRSTEAGSTFTCKFRSADFKPCTSPLKLKNLKRGSYTLTVLATDAVGNVDTSPAIKTFRVR